MLSRQNHCNRDFKSSPCLFDKSSMEKWLASPGSMQEVVGSNPEVAAKNKIKTEVKMNILLIIFSDLS